MLARGRTPTGVKLAQDCIGTRGPHWHMLQEGIAVTGTRHCGRASKCWHSKWPRGAAAGAEAAARIAAQLVCGGNSRASEARCGRQGRARYPHLPADTGSSAEAVLWPCTCWQQPTDMAEAAGNKTSRAAGPSLGCKVSAACGQPARCHWAAQGQGTGRHRQASTKHGGRPGSATSRQPYPDQWHKKCAPRARCGQSPAGPCRYAPWQLPTDMAEAAGNKIGAN